MGPQNVSVAIVWGERKQVGSRKGAGWANLSHCVKCLRPGHLKIVSYASYSPQGPGRCLSTSLSLISCRLGPSPAGLGAGVFVPPGYLHPSGGVPPLSSCSCPRWSCCFKWQQDEKHLPAASPPPQGRGPCSDTPPRPLLT